MLYNHNGEPQILDVDCKQNIPHGYVAQYLANNTGSADTRGDLVSLDKFVDGELVGSVDVSSIDFNKVDVTQPTVLANLARKIKNELKR